jgi:hypothetical protein
VLIYSLRCYVMIIADQISYEQPIALVNEPVADKGDLTTSPKQCEKYEDFMLHNCQ